MEYGGWQADPNYLRPVNVPPLHRKLNETIAALITALNVAAQWQGARLYRFDTQHLARLDTLADKGRTALDSIANGAIPAGALPEVRAKYDSDIAAIQDEAERNWHSQSTASFDRQPWKEFGINARDSTPPDATRIGTITHTSEWSSLTVPLCLPLMRGTNLLIEASGAAKDAALGLVQATMLRLLGTMPPGKMRMTLVDPVGLGQNVAAFMRLGDYDETLVTGKAWTEPNHIEQRLTDLSEHMENVIQKYLRNEFASIEDYNRQAEDIPEPYRLLVVANFPVGFSDVAARRLVSIAQNGPRCGVHVLVHVDTEKPFPHGFDLNDLRQSSSIVRWTGKHFTLVGGIYEEYPLEPDCLPDNTIVDRVISSVGEAAQNANRVEVPFERIAPANDAWWSASTDSGVRLGLGPAGARKVQFLDLGKGTSQHVLIAGKTGSGKSTLLHTLITQAALTYSPDELQFYLIDFKKGVEFKTYATHSLPHARVIAIESEREFGLSVLQGLDAELRRRGDVFRGVGVDGLADYRAKTREPLPRILLLVDEFQEFFTEGDVIASHAAQILDRLVRQGRAFGIHVLLGSQTLAGAFSLARPTMDQMAVRIALQCSEADSRLILADDNPAARLLERPGEAIYNAANGTAEGNNRFQVAWLSDEERDRYLGELHTMAAKSGRTWPQLVFEGNAPALLGRNATLVDLLERSSSDKGRHDTAWLGEPIAIRDATAAVFRPQGASNLVIVGHSDEECGAMIASAMIGLAACQSADHAPCRFYVLDFGPSDSQESHVIARIAAELPMPTKIGRRRDLAPILEELSSELAMRIESGTSAGPAVYLFIIGLQRARDLRPEEGYPMPPPYGEPTPPPSPSKLFSTLLREGPEVGIHVITSCDTVTNLSRTIDRRSIREFGHRVAFQMSIEDSAVLIDSPAASKLGPNRAFLFSEDEGRLEKFRPYALPDADWVSWALERLKSREME